MRTMTMRKRLFYIFLAFSLVSVLLVALGACYISFKHVMKMATTTSEQLVDKTADEVDNLLNDMSLLPRIIGRSSQVQSVLRTEYGQYRDQFSDRFELDAYLSEMNQYNDSIFAMYFFADNGLASKSKYFTFIDEQITDNIFYRQSLHAGKTIWLPPMSGSRFAVTTGENLITTITPVKELGSGQYQGAVVIELAEERVRAFLNTRISDSGFLYLQDAAGHMLLWPSDMTEQEASAQLARMSATSPMFTPLRIEKTIDCNGWTVVGIVPGQELAKNVRNIFAVVVAVSLGVVVAALLLAHYLAGRLVGPIIRLDQNMRQVELGDLSVRASSIPGDEIGKLTLRFNTMLETIQRLMEREADNQQKLRMSELKALQAQIKPHFLYNTLDSIMWLARRGDRDGVLRMVMALTRFLKIGLSGGREIITLREEIEHASSYLVIQNIRYKDQFEHSITVKPELMDCRVPKLVLQPLIENAIYHGLKEKREKGRLMVQAQGQNGWLVITVSDNGVGMSEEVAALLRSRLESGQSTHGDSYGVVNVHQRIRVLYGTPYGITLTSEQGVGSCFRITMPKTLDEEEEA